MVRIGLMRQVRMFTFASLIAGTWVMERVATGCLDGRRSGSGGKGFPGESTPRRE